MTYYQLSRKRAKTFAISKAVHILTKIIHGKMATVPELVGKSGNPIPLGI
jgi:hypothetical protein